MSDKAFSLPNILKGMDRVENADQDIRYMAVSDLTKELEKESYKPDQASQKKIVTSLVTVIQTDTASEVRSCAIKALLPLIKKLNEESSKDIFDLLSKTLYENKDEPTRDLAGSGMKIMLESISMENARGVIRILVPKLITGAGDGTKDRVQMSLELIGELLSRFGSELKNDAEKIEKVLRAHVTGKDNVSKKKAVSCLGHLSVVASDSLFDTIIKFLVESITKTKEAQVIRTYVQCIGTISRFSAARMGKYVDQVFPIVTTYMDHKDFKSDDKYDEELREICLQTLEALVTKCPKELTSYLDTIEKTSIQFIKHDPNAADEMDVGEQDDGSDAAGSDDGGDDDDEDYQDDFDDEDDLSWKVRKSASRCLTALIRAYPSQVPRFYGDVSKALISRFAEHEDNVRLEVLNTFLALLQQTAALGIATSNLSHGAGADNIPEHIAGLVGIVPAVVKETSKLIKDKSTKVPTRVVAFQVLRQMTIVLHGGLDNHLKALLNASPSTFSKNTSSALKSETLMFLNSALTLHSASHFSPYAAPLWACVEASIKDQHYKIITEGLVVAASFVKVLTAENATNDQAKTYLPKLYTICQTKFTPNDLDKEVKEAAITAISLIISRAGSLLSQQNIDDCLKVLSSRVTSEVVRVVAIKGLSDIADSPLKISLSSVITSVTETLTALLRQQSRALRTSAVTALSTLVQHDHLTNHADLLKKIVMELGSLFNPTEAHLSHLALKLATGILHVDPASATSVASQLLEPATALFSAAVLQGAILDSLIGFLVACAQSGNAALSLNVLLPKLVTIGTTFDPSASSSTRTFYACLSQAIAALVVLDQAGVNAQIDKAVSDASSTSAKLSSQLLSIYNLGEIGRRHDVSSKKDVREVLFKHLDSSIEDVKVAASAAIGGIAVGNLSAFLPDILTEITKQPKNKYLLLTSIREVIVSHSRNADGMSHLKPYFQQLNDLLVSLATSEEEGIRNIVAECWGKLALINSSEVFKGFVAHSKDTNAYTRSTVVSALKYAITTEQSTQQEIDTLLAAHLTVFLDALKDAELSVRHAALLTLNYLSSHRASIIRPSLATYLPVLYGETKYNPALVVTVKLGPFEHKMDNGVTLRQAAYECMYTLLDTSLGQLDLATFTKAAYEGFKDESSVDNKALKMLLLTKLCQRAPLAVLASLDGVSGEIGPIIAIKPVNPNEPAPERQDELVRTALRLIIAIQGIDGSAQNAKWVEFVEKNVMGNENKAKYEQVKKDSK